MDKAKMTSLQELKDKIFYEISRMETIKCDSISDDSYIVRFPVIERFIVPSAEVTYDITVIKKTWYEWFDIRSQKDFYYTLSDLYYNKCIPKGYDIKERGIRQFKEIRGIYNEYTIYVNDVGAFRFSGVMDSMNEDYILLNIIMDSKKKERK